MYSMQRPWARMVGDLVADLGIDVFDGPKSRLKKRLTEIAVQRGLEAEEAFRVS